MATVLAPNNKTNQQQADPTQLQTIGTAAPSAPATTSQAAPKPQPQGSGRFTNIQKYLGANKAGGQQVANKIGSGIQSGLSKEQEATKKYNEQLGKSVSDAKGVAQQGAGFQKDLGQIGTDIGNAGISRSGYDKWREGRSYQMDAVGPEEQARRRKVDYELYQQEALKNRGNQNIASVDAFTQRPDFNQFQDIQAGRGIDENLLANQQQRLAGQANNAANMASTAQQQLGNEGGRFELLRKTFGGAARPGYGQGQQRLDQMLLGQGGGLGKVQSDVAGQSRDLQAQAKDANSQKNEVGRLAQQEKDLMSGINTQTGANEQSYLDMLNSYVDPLNQQRSTEVQNVGKALGSYNKPYDPTNPGLNADQMSKFGLTDNNQGVYNVFKGQPYADPTGATDELKNRSRVSFAGKIGRDASGYQDTANQADVSRYAALSKMMGGNAGTPKLTKASDLESAYGAKTDGTEGLREQLSSAQKTFEQKDKIHGVDQYGNYADSTVNDLINNGGSPVNSIYSNGVNGFGQYGTNGGTSIAGKAVQKSQYDQLQKYLQEQNYGQTLGGRRETFLDSAPGYAAANPKLSAVPITGTDPSLNRDKGLTGSTAPTGPLMDPVNHDTFGNGNMVSRAADSVNNAVHRTANTVNKAKKKIKKTLRL